MLTGLPEINIEKDSFVNIRTNIRRYYKKFQSNENVCENINLTINNIDIGKFNVDLNIFITFLKSHIFFVHSSTNIYIVINLDSFSNINFDDHKLKKIYFEDKNEFISKKIKCIFNHKTFFNVQNRIHCTQEIKLQQESINYNHIKMLLESCSNVKCFLNITKGLDDALCDKENTIYNNWFVLDTFNSDPMKTITRFTKIRISYINKTYKIIELPNLTTLQYQNELFTLDFNKFIEINSSLQTLILNYHCHQMTYDTLINNTTLTDLQLYNIDDVNFNKLISCNTTLKHLCIKKQEYASKYTLNGISKNLLSLITPFFFKINDIPHIIDSNLTYIESYIYPDQHVDVNDIIKQYENHPKEILVMMLLNKSLSNNYSKNFLKKSQTLQYVLDKEIDYLNKYTNNNET